MKKGNVTYLKWANGDPVKVGHSPAAVFAPNSKEAAKAAKLLINELSNYEGFSEQMKAHSEDGTIDGTIVIRFEQSEYFMFCFNEDELASLDMPDKPGSSMQLYFLPYTFKS